MWKCLNFEKRHLNISPFPIIVFVNTSRTMISRAFFCNKFNFLFQFWAEKSIFCTTKNIVLYKFICKQTVSLMSHSRQSAKLFLQSSELGLPQPLKPPPLLVPGGGAHTLAKEGVREYQFRRGDIHCGTLYMYVLCASCPQSKAAFFVLLTVFFAVFNIIIDEQCT